MRRRTRPRELVRFSSVFAVILAGIPAFIGAKDSYGAGGALLVIAVSVGITGLTAYVDRRRPNWYRRAMICLLLLLRRWGGAGALALITSVLCVTAAVTFFLFGLVDIRLRRQSIYKDHLTLPFAKIEDSNAYLRATKLSVTSLRDEQRAQREYLIRYAADGMFRRQQEAVRGSTSSSSDPELFVVRSSRLQADYTPFSLLLSVRPGHEIMAVFAYLTNEGGLLGKTIPIVPLKTPLSADGRVATLEVTRSNGGDEIVMAVVVRTTAPGRQLSANHDEIFQRLAFVLQ